MRLRHGLIILACCLAAGAAEFEVLPGQRILLKGDSITRGYGFGNYTDPSPLRSLPGIAGLLLGSNLARPPQFLRLESYWEGLNLDGSAKTVDSVGAEIRIDIAKGELRAGDWLVYEDAGPIDKAVHPAPWPWTKDLYTNYRGLLRDLVLAAEKTIGRDHIVFMTMFDYKPNCETCDWDEPLDDGVHSGNDAIRDEAKELGIRVIDMNRIMDAAERYLEQKGWGRAVGPDGIHPNVYGNFVMTMAILGELGADLPRWRLDALIPRFAHPAALGDVPSVWGFSKDPSDGQRKRILQDLRTIVAEELKASKQAPAMRTPAGAGIQRIVRHGRILDRAAKQPERTSNPVIYELGKLFQLDHSHLLLVASMREQGGHDFCVGK